MPKAVNHSTPRLDLGVALEEFPIGTGLQLVADRILPLRGVPKKAATFSVITRESILRDSDVGRSAEGAYPRDSFDKDDVSYRCEEKGLEGELGDDQRAFYSSDFDAEMVTVGLTRDRLARAREKRVKEAIFNTTTFTGAALYTDNSGTPWDAAATVIPTQIEAVKQQMRQNCGMQPNTIVFGASQVPNLQKNTDLIDRLKYTQVLTFDAIVSQLSALFGIPNVIIAGAVRNVAPEGETLSVSDIWPDDYAWFGVVPETDNLAEPGIGRTLLWTEDSPELYTVESYYEVQTRKWIYRVRHHLQEKIIDPYFGHLTKIDV